MILVAMVTIFAGKCVLPGYQHIYIYNMEKCHLLGIARMIICMSTEPSGHQHFETAVTI